MMASEEHDAVVKLWTEVQRLAREGQLHSSAAGEIIANALRAYADAQRERDAQTISALHCPECRAGQTPAYDEYWRAWYHGTLLCLGSPARLALRS